MADINTNGILKSLEDMYTKKNFEEASSLLIKNKDSLETGLFHYNLGTVYAKWGNLAAGRYHLEKSIKNGYINSQSVNNLEYVKEKLAVDDLGTSGKYYDQFMDTGLGLPVSAFGLFALSTMVVVLVLTKLNKIKNLGLSFLIIALGFSPLIYKKYHLENINYAVLLEDGIVREGPSRIFDKKASLNSGTKIIITTYDDGWYFISNPVHLTGWIERKNLGIY
ncbi:MAG: SH3 domain-containing protein [Bacteriovoracaceae bacterium]|nr:SH3 domain-containing protein [Bacteriovoracaceae bacterium]